MPYRYGQNEYYAGRVQASQAAAYDLPCNKLPQWRRRYHYLVESFLVKPLNTHALGYRAEAACHRHHSNEARNQEMDVRFTMRSGADSEAENNQVHQRRDHRRNGDLIEVASELDPFFPEYRDYAHVVLSVTAACVLPRL